MKNLNYWVEKLDLSPHPEGGFFKENYRCNENIAGNTLPPRFLSDRSISTSIYFLLEKGQKSAFHRIKSDEIWHFYDGYPLTIYVIDNNGELIIYKLGLDPENNVLPQIVIPANCWFAAETEGDFTLVGCTVSPGFDFSDFELAKKQNLISEYPNQHEIIEKFSID